MAKIKSGDKVQFVAGNGKRHEGVVSNAAFYPGGTRSGKHFRIKVGTTTATIFANGPVGRSVERV